MEKVPCAGIEPATFIKSRTLYQTELARDKNQKLKKRDVRARVEPATAWCFDKDGSVRWEKGCSSNGPPFFCKPLNRYPSLASVVSWGRLKLAKTLSAPILCIAIDNIRFFIHKRLLLIYLGFLGPSKPCFVTFGRFRSNPERGSRNKIPQIRYEWFLLAEIDKSLCESFLWRAKLMINFRST